MKQITNAMSPNIQSQSNMTDEEFEQKKIDDYNNSKGQLNDGFHCDTCNDKGKVRFLYQGYPVSKPCDCMIKRKSIRIAQTSGMKDLLKYRVNDFKVSELFQKRMKELAIDYVQNGADEWFALLGQSGCGKTMLCSAIANTFINKDVQTLYVSWTTMLNQFKANISKSDELLSIYQNVKVLYIDDLFKGNLDKEGKQTEYSKTIAYSLINYRYNKKLITIISSELSIDEILTIDEAVAGRIKERTQKYCLYLENEEGRNFRFKKGV